MYIRFQVIGNGAYGVVYRARDLVTSAIVALKKVRIALTSDGIPMTTLREISLLKQLDSFQHPNIVKLLDVVHGRIEGDTLLLFLVFEHLDQDLADFISRNSSSLTKSTIQQFSKHLLNGVDFLHSHRIIHRDLKPSNLLISRDRQLKIADFGLAKTYDFEMRLTSVVVTLWYRAPEILLGQSYNSNVDIWSAGCIIAEMFARKALFPGTSETSQIQKIFELVGRPDESCLPEDCSLNIEQFLRNVPNEPRLLNDIIPQLCQNSCDLLQQMLDFNSKKRPSALSCLQHAYFTEESL